MKSYRFEEFNGLWWAEYRTDGMQNSIEEKIVSIRSKLSGGELNPTDIPVELVILGLPNHVGAATSEYDLKAKATELGASLTKRYEAVAPSELIAAENTQNDILTFDFINGPNAALSADVVGVVDSVAKTVALTVPALTVVTALVATFTLSENAAAAVGVTAQVSATTPNNFTNPVEYDITAEHGEVSTWTVTVTVAA